MNAIGSLRLFEYFRSSASYRLRIGLNLKGLSYESVPIHLTRSGGVQFEPSFRAINPSALVPVLETGEGVLSQSLAILEYLEECYPEPPLLPSAMVERAHVREFALSVACDIHPLNNLRVLRYLRDQGSFSEEQVRQWVQHWIRIGFDALESRLAGVQRRWRYCFGDKPSLADCCLIPQMFNARRFGMQLEGYPNLRSIEEQCLGVEAFQRAHPAQQPDAE